jgi:hypothetical protein
LIEKGAFKNCNTLQTAVVGNGVTSIGEEAFANCVALLSISLGESIKSIGDNAFLDCNSIVGIICKPQTPPVVNFLGFSDKTAIYVPQKKEYKKAIGWSNHSKQFRRLK